MHIDHPGHLIDCPDKIKVTPLPYSMSSAGYACSITGGHCVPNNCTKNEENEDGTISKNNRKGGRNQGKII